MARIKCSRCDRHYSGMRLKCPYCGAHRSKKTVRKEQEEMSNSKFLIGGIVLIALIAAVVILIIVSAGSKPADKANNSDKIQDNQEYVQDDGVQSVDGVNNDDAKPDASTPDEDANKTTVNSVRIIRNGEVKTDVTFYIGDTYEYSYETDPADVDETAVWSSDNEDVAVVLQNGEVTGLSEGTANITVTIGGQSATMVVRVNS